MKINQALLEEVIRVKVNVLQTGAHNGLKSLVVTSANHGEGTSNLVAHLAFAFALGGKSRILLIDANIRRPSLHALFGHKLENGFYDLVSGNTDLAESIKDTPYPNIKIMTAGQPLHDDGLAVLSTISHDTKSSIEKDFDWVLYDTAPVNCYPDTLVVTALSDGVILVILAEKTRRAAVYKAKESLESINARIIGAVLNGRRYVVPRFIYKRL